MSRTSYHHGNLANALEDAAVELARAGGPEAVVLREVARRAGVSPTAAYRHFASQRDLLERVKLRALAELAERITTALTALPAVGDPAEAAVARVLAAGRAYIDFARAEPGCFATAFRRTDDGEGGGGGGTGSGGEAGGGARNGSGGRAGGGAGGGEADGGPLRYDGALLLLGSLLDELVAAGRMPAEARPHAEYAAWAAVHGVAVLLLDGPLRRQDTAAQNAAVDRTLRLVIDGFTVGPTRSAGPAGE
ncbi:TetR/AcrR family transcriptional regulator [Streptomyces sp.]|uniref:TetR/AcrR family transcriptional regulator n=1 Tax=Streptomyces sp. TaxID=1931 RepID=UPI002F3E505D